MKRGVTIATARALAALGVGVVSVANCSGGGTGVGGEGDSIAIQDLGSRDSQAECSRAVRCGVYPDQATCVAANPPLLGQLMADVQAGKVKYDGAAASECLTALAAQSCPLSASPPLKYPEACRKAFQGTAVAGEPCFINQECVSGSCNLPPTADGTTCIAGTCDAVVVPAAQGEICTFATQQPSCVDGTDCRAIAGGTSMTCQPQVALGGACGGPEDCVAGLSCLENALGAVTCQALPSEGQPCVPSGVPCAAFVDICDVTSHTCVRRSGVGGGCPTGQECVAYATCDAGTRKCVLRGDLGTPRPVPLVCP
jgi:hypothetical protein